MTKPSFQFLMVAIVLAAAATLNRSAFAQAPANQSQAEAAIRQAGKEYLAAIEKGDAAAMATFWTEEGTFTDEHGQTFKSRDLIEQSFAAKRATNQATRPTIKVNGSSIRFLTPDVALQEGTCQVMHLQGAPVSGCFSAVWVRRDNKWKLATLNESRIDAPPAPAQRVAALEPFVGQWSGQADSFSMRMSANWNAGKTYLRRELVASSNGEEVFHGTQFVGWDPILQEIRSWTFNEDGGYAEGLWSLEGNVWMVASKGVKPTGESNSTTHIYKFLSKDKLLWKVKRAGEESATTDFQIELTRNAKP